MSYAPTFEKVIMTQSRTDDLQDAADAAYRCARAIVYDVLPIGVRLDQADLTIRQRRALAVLADAELDLERYRSDQAEVMSS
jgi:hypothetical protein